MRTPLAQSKMIDPSKPIQTRQGTQIRMISTNMPGLCSLAGYVIDHVSPSEPLNLLLWDRRGKFFGLDKEHCLDIANVPTKRKGWIGVAIAPIQRCDGIIADSSHVYPTEEEARRQTNFRTFIEIEFDE